MFLRRRQHESYDQMRKRLVHETEVALLYGLRFPQRMPRIPTMEVSQGRFEPGFAQRSWELALDLRDSEEFAWKRLSWTCPTSD